MVWDTLWALTLGFVLSGAVQAFISRREMGQMLGKPGPVSVLRATGFGAVSSSCSYAASAMAKSLFAKGADFVAAMVFMFASTNLVVELGVVLAVLIGWQFTASEFLGGLLMILMFALLAQVAFPKAWVERARARLAGNPAALAEGAACAPSMPPPDPAEPGWRERIRTRQGWSDAAGYAAADLTMLRKEMGIGFLVAGFLAALVPSSVWQVVFLTGHGFWSSLENAIVGPFIAIISFVCSVGNVPLAAALWKGGISFGGVVSFIFADLITLPLLLIYRRFYGVKVTLLILGSFWLVMAAAGLATQYIFMGLHILPPSRPTQLVPGAFSLGYTSALDAVALAVLAVVFWESHRRRSALQVGRYAVDPVCHMQVEVANAPAWLDRPSGRIYLCSDRCRDRLAAEPDRYLKGDSPMNPANATTESLPAIDPVCGMTVDRANPAATLTLGETTYYFCCVGCRDSFAGDPERYLRTEKAPATAGAPPAPTAVDPICGMSVDTGNPGASFSLAGTTHYFCSTACAQEFERRLVIAASAATSVDTSGR